VVSLTERPGPGRLEDFIPEAERYNPPPPRTRHASDASGAPADFCETSVRRPRLVRNFDLQTVQWPLSPPVIRRHRGHLVGLRGGGEEGVRYQNGGEKSNRNFFK
jgi:hypothetical protein